MVQPVVQPAVETVVKVLAFTLMVKPVVCLGGKDRGRVREREGERGREVEIDRGRE